MTHSLIASLQILVEQAQSVPQEEARLAQLTDRLAQVADERARCVELLETGRRASVQLEEAERLIDLLLNPPTVQYRTEDCTIINPDRTRLEVSSNSPSISEPIPVPGPHEMDGPVEPATTAEAPSAEEDATPSEDMTAAPTSNSESNSEPELIEQPGEEEAQASEEQDAPTLTIPERILAALAPDRQLTSRQLADELRLSSGNVSSALSKMIAGGRVKNDGNYPPRYRLPEIAQVNAPASASQEAPRDREDRQAMRQVAERTPVHTPPPTKVKPITEQDEQAVLGALLARPNRRGSAALLSGKASMSTDRVKEVLTHLAEAGRVIAPPEGENLWSLA